VADAKYVPRLIRIDVEIFRMGMNAQPQESAGTDEILSRLIANSIFEVTGVRIEDKNPRVVWIYTPFMREPENPNRIKRR